MGEYQNAFKNFFKDELKDGKTLHTDTINEEKRGINKMALLQHDGTITTNGMFINYLLAFLIIILQFMTFIYQKKSYQCRSLSNW